MITYKLFEFATTPRTGTTWFMNAAYAVGLGNGFKSDVHLLFPKQRGTLPRVTLVRHPCDWLRSYYQAIYPAKLGLPTDVLSDFRDASDFDMFVRMYLRRRPGEVGRIFDSYKADVCLRTEDLNVSFPDFCVQLGMRAVQADKAKRIPRYNCTKQPAFWNPALHERVLTAEAHMLERYDY